MKTAIQVTSLLLLACCGCVNTKQTEISYSPPDYGPRQKLWNALYYASAQFRESFSSEILVGEDLPIKDIDVRSNGATDLLGFVDLLEAQRYICDGRYENAILISSPGAVRLKDNPLDTPVQDFSFYGDHDEFVKKLSSLFPNGPPAQAGKFSKAPAFEGRYRINIRGGISIRDVLMTVASKYGISWRATIRENPRFIPLELATLNSDGTMSEPLPGYEGMGYTEWAVQLDFSVVSQNWKGVVPFETPLERILKFWPIVTGQDWRYDANEVENVFVSYEEMTRVRGFNPSFGAMSNCLSSCGFSVRRDNENTNVFHVFKMDVDEE